jgi:uncharacterized membrane protein YcaP (DUF421 family)
MQNELLEKYFGVSDHISIIEITVRSIIMFIATFLIIRFTGMRQFRQNSPFDMVIAFLVGGVLSRGVVGATPLFASLASGLALILLQKILYKISFDNKRIERIMKGQPYLIYKDGKFIKDNMRKADITTLEIFEDMRVDLKTDKLDDVAEIYVEKTGEISFVKKDKK